MTLRRRLALVAGLAVALAAIVVALVSYIAVRDQLRGQVDDALYQQAQLALDDVQGLFRTGGVPALPERKGGSARYAQLVYPGGTRVVPTPRSAGVLPVDGQTRRLTRARQGEHLMDTRVDGVHVRVLSVALGPGALELGRSLTSVDDALRGLRTVLAILCAAGVALASGLGALAARRIIAPIVRLSRAARHIGETEDLSQRIDVHGHDEVAELARRFNAMLAALQASQRSQRQLVADASHELRTPITSLRTNIEVLLEEDDLPAEQRRRILSDVLAQSEELGSLVADLIELAREEGHREPLLESVRLDELVAAAVERARRNAREVPIRTTLEPVVIGGDPARLTRAVNNLLDNAIKHTPPGTAVEVAVAADGVRVRDHGDGIAPADLPHLFDRFYRGASARARSGSGLGLAIVRRVAQAHGGEVSAANAPGGGALFHLRLPAAKVEATFSEERSLA